MIASICVGATPARYRPRSGWRGCWRAASSLQCRRSRPRSGLALRSASLRVPPFTALLTFYSSTSTASPATTRTRRRADWRSTRSRAGRLAAPGRVGEGRPQAARAPDAAGREERRPDEATYDAAIALAGDVARSRGGGASESRPNGDDPPAHANRIPERHPRSARARRRRRLAAARRRVELRLRQRDGRRSVADAARPLHVGGGEDQPRRGRPAQPLARRRDDQDAAGPHAGGAPRGPADRHARRRGASHYTFPLDGEYEIQVRLMRDRDEHVEGLSEPHDLELLLDKARAAGVHGEAAAARAGARDRGSAPQDPCAGAGGPARARRRFPEETVAAARNGAPAVPGALQLLPASAGPAGHLLDLDHRSVWRAGSRRHAEPAPALRRSQVRRRLGGAGRQRPRRATDPDDADAAGVPAARDRGRPSQGRWRSTGRPRRRRLRRGHRDGAVGRAREPAVPVPRRARSGRHSAEHAVSRQRSRAGVAAVLLSLEQHSGR